MTDERFINIEEEIAALAYFVPDFKDNPEIAAVITEISKAAEKKAILEAEKECCIPFPPESDGVYHGNTIALPDLVSHFAAPCDASPCYGSKPFPLDEESEAEFLMRELADMNEETLRGIGLSEKSIKFILSMKVKPSRMHITRHAKIILVDYDNLEIKLDDKTKALYFLFLRHPEGIAIKALQEHYNELLDLYQSISGRDDSEGMQNTIKNLVAPYNNDANISLSRIKRAFGESFCNNVAENYYVSGLRGEPRKVTLDRGLVTWETIR